MTFRHTSLQESITFRRAAPFSPMAIRVKPTITANTRLKYCSAGKSSHRIGRDQVLDGIQNAGHLCSLNVRGCHFKLNVLAKVDQSRDDQSCQAGKGSGAQEKDHGTCSDLTSGAGTSNTGDTHNNGTEYQREDHHVQGVHVDASNQADNSQYRLEAVRQKKSSENTKDQPGKIAVVGYVSYTRINSSFALLK